MPTIIMGFLMQLNLILTNAEFCSEIPSAKCELRQVVTQGHRDCRLERWWTLVTW